MKTPQGPPAGAKPDAMSTPRSNGTNNHSVTPSRPSDAAGRNTGGSINSKPVTPAAPAGSQKPTPQATQPQPQPQPPFQQPSFQQPPFQQPPHEQMFGPGPTPQQPPTQRYSLGAAGKQSYSRKVKPGETITKKPSALVQAFSEPVREVGDFIAVNNNLPEEMPGYVRTVFDRPRLDSNIDRNSFARDLWRGGLGSQMGSMMGSMYDVNPAVGSVFGVYGGPGQMIRPGSLMAMRSMYGMGSMYGPMGSMTMISRPASLFGSQYGSQCGSQYGFGGNSMMGSMYNRSSMYGTGGASYSFSNMPSNMQSAMPSSNAIGSQYNTSTLGANNSFFSDPIAPPIGMERQEPIHAPSTQGIMDPSAGPPGGPMSQARSRAMPANAANKDTIKGVVLIGGDASGMVAPVSITPNPMNPRSITIAGVPQAPVDEVFKASPTGQGPVEQWKQGQSYQALIKDVSAGHNAAVLIARGNTPHEAHLTKEAVTAVIMDSLNVVEHNARSGLDGYYDVQVYCCAFASATEAIDVVESGIAGQPKPVQLGSHPVFGTTFKNAQSTTIRDVNGSAQAINNILEAAGSDNLRMKAPVVAVELITKQVCLNPKTNEKDVLLASVLVLVSNNSNMDADSFFDAMRNGRMVPASLVENVIGGACHTVAVLCLAPTADPAVAASAHNSLQGINSVKNSVPRSGNISRFVTFATSEVEKMKQKSDVDPAVTRRIDDLLNNGTQLLRDPQNTVPIAPPVKEKSSSRSAAQARSAMTPMLSGMSNDAGKADNPIRIALVAAPDDDTAGVPPTFMIQSDGLSLTSPEFGVTCTANEVVMRRADDWRVVSTSKQVEELQGVFEGGSNAALIGTISPNEVHALDKQPLWLSYKRMVSSLISAAAQRYTFAEVSLSVALIGDNELLADLLAAPSASGEAPEKKRLHVASSPLFGPTVYQITSIKPPTPLQLESTINSALGQVPAILAKYPDVKPLIFASAVLKGVTDSDVITSSLIAASTQHTDVFMKILDKDSSSPYELFEHALGGPCCTLFLGDLVQGDSNFHEVAQLIGRLQNTPNRAVRSCSVKKFISFAEESIRKANEKLPTASEKERERITKNNKNMEIFRADYAALFEDPQNRDPKTYRKSGSKSKEGASQGSGSQGTATSVAGAERKRHPEPAAAKAGDKAPGKPSGRASAKKDDRASAKKDDKVSAKKDDKASAKKDNKRKSSHDDDADNVSRSSSRSSCSSRGSRSSRNSRISARDRKGSAHRKGNGAKKDPRLPRKR